MRAYYILQDKKAMSEAAASYFVTMTQKAINKNGRCTVSLSGGSTPKLLFELLATEEYRDQVEWKKLHIFWGDERCVAPDSPDYNARMASLALLDHVPIPGTQIHKIDGTLRPEEAAKEYEKVLKSYFDTTGPTFDICFLGMGDDGHTASLFPGTPVVHETQSWAKEVYVEKKSSWRISVTAPIINRSSSIAFLVGGAGKAEVLPKVLGGDFQPDLYPSQLIVRGRAEVHWFLDEGAVGELNI